eukprot:15074614-Alexandrium_andersonii.AAC.1
MSRRHSLRRLRRCSTSWPLSGASPPHRATLCPKLLPRSLALGPRHFGFVPLRASWEDQARPRNYFRVVPTG